MTAQKYAKVRRYQFRLITEGLCVKCRKPRDGKSQWRCTACLKKMAEKQAERAKRSAAAAAAGSGVAQ